ncbi:MAG: hypothetical protein AABM29_03520 [Actinomycetota bacterium]
MSDRDLALDRSRRALPLLDLETTDGRYPLSRLSWLPAVGLSAVFTALLLAWDPQVQDLAAQSFRTELFERNGFAIWNGSWYGGHYTLTYSVLFPPLAALLGARIVGAISVVASTYLFDRLVRRRWGEQARWATLWYGVGAVTLLASGQLTFALGVAVGLLALYLFQLRLGRWAVLASLGCALASPVAAVFLAGILLAVCAGGSFPRRPVAIAMAAVAVGVVGLLNWAFPDSGRFPFVFSSFIAVPLWCAGALLLTRNLAGERQFRAVVWAYLAGAALIWLVPNPLGGNAIRLGTAFGGPVLAAILLAHRPRVHPVAVAIVLVGSLYWQVLGGVRAVVQSRNDPSTHAGYYHPVRSWLRAHGASRTRIEVVPTANHWEAAYLAPNFPIARGWLRQLDTTRDEIFYDGHLSSRLYRGWLRSNGVRYVALSDASLDYSGVRERSLILRDPGYLRLRWSSPHWRVYEVSNPSPLVISNGPGWARLVSVGSDSFTVQVLRPGSFTARIRYTPYWSVSAAGACVEQAGDWTRMRATRPGTFRVAIRVTPGNILGLSDGRDRC